jgi:hypothetical protein
VKGTPIGGKRSVGLMKSPSTAESFREEEEMLFGKSSSSD